MFFKPFYVYCGECGHRNRPHRSPREGIRLALLGQVGECKGCKATLHVNLPDRPLVQKVRAELAQLGLLVHKAPQLAM